MYDVVVLGAGVVGLSTAVNIQQHVPDCHVTLVADKFLQDTTSHGAAGSFRVTLEHATREYEQRYRKWSQDSFNWYEKLEREYDPAMTGVLRMSGYQINTTKRQNPYHCQFIYNSRDMTEKELQSIPGNNSQGWFYTTMLTECRRYLPWLTKLFLSNGGRIEKRKVHDLCEFVGQCRVLVNCAGLSSGHFVKDKLVYPVRGHVIRVKAPWIKHFYIINNGQTYIYPGQDTVVLGGTRHKGEHDLDVSDHWFEDVKTRCANILPGLKQCLREIGRRWKTRAARDGLCSPNKAIPQNEAEEIQRWVGLRPSRSEIRLESEMLEKNGKTLQIVHNYGHGGNGVSLSWGTGIEAAQIVKHIVTHGNVKNDVTRENVKSKL